MVCRVEWEFWTSSNDACGAGCDRQSRFKAEIAETAITLEKVCVWVIDLQITLSDSIHLCMNLAVLVYQPKSWCAAWLYSIYTSLHDSALSTRQQQQNMCRQLHQSRSLLCHGQHSHRLTRQIQGATGTVNLQTQFDCCLVHGD